MILYSLTPEIFLLNPFRRHKFDHYRRHYIQAGKPCNRDCFQMPLFYFIFSFSFLQYSKTSFTEKDEDKRFFIWKKTVKISWPFDRKGLPHDTILQTETLIFRTFIIIHLNIIIIPQISRNSSPTSVNRNPKDSFNCW